MKLATAEARNSGLVSEPNYNENKLSSENLSAIENKKAYIFWNKPVLSKIKVLSKIVMYEFWYKQVKPKHGEKAKTCYMEK